MSAASDRQRKLIAKALLNVKLPRQSSEMNSETSVNAIHGVIETWRTIAPLIKPQAEKVERLVKTADAMEKAIEKAGEILKKIGVKESEIIDSATKEATRRHSAEIDLFLICWRAIDGLRKWNRSYRPKRGTPKKFSADLTNQLEYLLRSQLGCSAHDFENFVGVLNDSTGSNLPKLSVATLKQRRYRKARTAATK